MNLWLTMLAAGLLTYTTRLSFIWLLGKVEISPLLRGALRFVPPAVLAAIVFPEVLMPSGFVDFSLENIRLLSGFLAALLAWRTKNAVLTIAVGMVVLWVLQSVVK